MNDLIEALCSAAFRGELDQVKKSLEHLDIRTFVNAPNSRGQTALYCAARNGHVPVVLELLNFAGIDPNLQVPDHGATPGHAAAFGPHPEALALLIAHGADMSIRNKHDLTPRQEARKQCIDVFKTYETGGLEDLKKKYPITLQLNVIKNQNVKLSKEEEELPVRRKSRRPTTNPAADFKAHFKCLIRNISCTNLSIPGKSTKTPSSFLKIDFGGVKSMQTEVVKREKNPEYKFTTHWDWTCNHVNSMYKKHLVIEYCQSHSLQSKLLGTAKIDLRALVSGPERYELEIFSLKDKTLKIGLGWVHFDMVIEEIVKPSMSLEVVVQPLAETTETFSNRSFYLKSTHVPFGVTNLSGLPHSKSLTLHQLRSHAFVIASQLPESSFKGLSRASIHLTLLSKKKNDRKSNLYKATAGIHVNKVLFIGQSTSCTEQMFDTAGNPIANIVCQFRWADLPAFVQMFGGKYNSLSGLSGCVAVPKAMPFQIKGVNVSLPKYVPDASQAAPSPEKAVRQLQSLRPPVTETSQPTNQLPPEWEEAFDEASGRLYYLNHRTKMTQWEPPEGYRPVNHMQVESESSTEEDSADSEFIAKWNASQDQLPPLPPDWEMDRDELGRIYYIDHKTKNTQWTHPLLHEELLKEDTKKSPSRSKSSFFSPSFQQSDQQPTKSPSGKSPREQSPEPMPQNHIGVVQGSPPQELLDSQQSPPITPEPSNPKPLNQPHPQQNYRPNQQAYYQPNHSGSGPGEQPTGFQTNPQNPTGFNTNHQQPPNQPNPQQDYQQDNPQNPPNQPYPQNYQPPQPTGFQTNPQNPTGFNTNPQQPYPQQNYQPQPNQSGPSPAVLAIQQAISVLPPGTDPLVLSGLQQALQQAMLQDAANQQPSQNPFNPTQPNPFHNQRNSMPNPFNNPFHNSSGGSIASRPPAVLSGSNPFLTNPPPVDPSKRTSLSFNPFLVSSGSETQLQASAPSTQAAPAQPNQVTAPVQPPTTAPETNGQNIVEQTNPHPPLQIPPQQEHPFLQPISEGQAETHVTQAPPVENNEALQGSRRLPEIPPPAGSQSPGQRLLNEILATPPPERANSKLKSPDGHASAAPASDPYSDANLDKYSS